MDHDQPLLAEVLARHVRNARVDYAALRAAPAPLDRYLALLAEVREADFEAWGSRRQMACLANLYNAATLQLVARHYPVRSIREIGGWLGNPWKQRFIRFLGQLRSLDELEHGMLRRRWPEPRVHFALVCAARGCPPLRAEPYLGNRLSEQLDDQGRRFLARTDSNRVDHAGRVLQLSPIFDWYRADFVADGRTLPEFVAPYLPDWEGERTLTYRVRFTDYDWSLNDAGPAA